jgi:hypothetical protein
MKKWLLDILRRNRTDASNGAAAPTRSGRFVRHHFFSQWDWRFDGRLAAFIALVYFYDRFGPPGRIREFSSLLAILFFGIILKRNLRKDVKWKELPDVLRKARSK